MEWAGAFLTPFRACRYALLSLCGALALIPAASHAQPWPSLPDGRLLIEIKGSKIALPSRDADLRDINFTTYPWSSLWTLDMVLRSPHEASEYFKSQKLINVSVPNVRGRGGLYLGRFDRETFLDFSAGVSFGENSQGNCRAWARNYEALLTEAARDGTRVGPDGWFEFINRKSPITYIYVRSESSPRLPKYFDSFSCDGSGPSGICTSSSCIGSNIGYVYKFSLRNNPRSDWPQAIQRAEQVLRFLLPDIQDRAEGR